VKLSNFQFIERFLHVIIKPAIVLVNLLVKSENCSLSDLHNLYLCGGLYFNIRSFIQEHHRMFCKF